MSGVEALPVTAWGGSADPALRQQAVTALEAGQVLFLPELAFRPDAAEAGLLTAATGDGRHKNISYDPASGRIGGTGLSAEAAQPLTAVMARFADAADALLRDLLPGYQAGLRRARTSFRPAEIAGRPMPWRKDDTRLHVDAFPSRPMRGRRILRVFANADPDGTPRRWHVGEAFEAHARRFLPRVPRALPGSAALLRLAGLTKGRRSPYDHLMLGLHDAAKRDTDYQATAEKEAVAFPAGSAWIVYTDQVPHAALSGRCAFEQTFEVDPGVMADRETTPLRVLERLTGRSLA